MQFHHYQRVSTRLPLEQLDLEFEPVSSSKALGWETGIVFTHYWKEGLALDARVSRFEPGAAFEGSGQSTINGLSFELTRYF